MRSTIPCMALCLGLASQAHAHSIKQKVAGYNDTDGRSRERVSYDMTVQGGTSSALNMTDSSYGLVLQNDSLKNDSMRDDQYDRDIYGSSYRTNQSVSASATQTWDRLTETRVLTAYATDHEVKSRTWSVGLSQWIWHETIRLAFDLSRTLIDQPLYQILDFDSEEVGNPTIASSTGATVSARHLASSTTIVDYSIGHIATDNRPDSNSASVAVRQFLPPMDGAVHGGVTRAYNRGYVTTATNYGQVDAWIYDLAYLQNLWPGAHARLGYRYYKEDQTTRAYGDDTVLGSDTTSLGFSQDLPKRAIDNIGVPLTIEAAAARYLTNVAIAATSFELGVTAKF